MLRIWDNNLVVDKAAYTPDMAARKQRYPTKPQDYAARRWANKKAGKSRLNITTFRKALCMTAK
jgi:hypothetical protein